MHMCVQGFSISVKKMRIITGKFKGRQLYSPKNQEIRPTSDRAREFLFSYLGNDVYKARVLDLFAGSGALGIEAVSRGAASAVFVDQSKEAVDLINRNLEKLGLSFPVIRRDAVSYLQSTLNEKFDLIFCDPPYKYTAFETLVERSRQQVLHPDGLLIYESDRRIDAPEIKGLEIIKVKKIGNTKMSIYRYV